MIAKLKLTTMVLLALLLGAAAMSGISNALLTRRFIQQHPASGTMVTVDGHAMYIFCRGEGTPAVVLEAGLGDESSVWAGVQRGLSRVTRVCAYDRAGMGWSDRVDAPRDAIQIAHELHVLLDRIGVIRPIVVGHSIGGLFARAYAERYPTEVSGLVMVDGTPPYIDRQPFFGSEDKLPPAWIVQTAMAAGVPRLLGWCSQPSAGLNAAENKLRGEQRCRLRYDEVEAEVAAFDRSSGEVDRTAFLSDLPLLVFSQDDRPHVHDNDSERAARRGWNLMQEQLRMLSHRGARVVASGSGHYVMLERRILVTRYLIGFVDAVRRKSWVSQPTARR